jgi:hypothetical protein
MTKRLLRSLMIAAMLTALWIAPGRAGSVIQKQMDFMGTSPSGSGLMSLVSGGSLSVQNALIQSIIATPSFMNLSITGGMLDFVTGTCKSGCFTTLNKQTHTYSTTPFFNWGGHLSITGWLPGMTVTPGPAPTLLYGTFSPTGLTSGDKNGLSVPNASLTTAKGGKGGFNGSLFISTINPEIYADFLPYIFKVPDSNGLSYMSEMFITVDFAKMGSLSGFKQPGVWSGSIGSTDIVVKPTPEPSGLFLLASVLLVGAGLLRRRSNSVA